MKKLSKKSLVALLMAFVLTLSLAACGDKPEPTDSSSESESGKLIFINTLSGGTGTSHIPELTATVQEKYELNSDTVGWLQVPGTHINDVVVWYPKDMNKYYYRRNFEKEYSFNGIYYADFRNEFGNGDSEALSHNTVIYGHTMSEDKDGVMFAPLNYFKEEDFARKTPYVYFSTMSEDLAFEVFAVFYATVSLPYNRPDLPNTEFAEVVDECIQRSIYNYDTTVGPDDKIITLSTCTYSVPGKGPVAYPNEYRYVVMGKLVDAKDATKTEATLEINPTPKEP